MPVSLARQISRRAAFAAALWSSAASLAAVLLLSGPAVERLCAAPIVEVAVTNTISIPENRQFPQLKVLSVGELLAKAIRFTHSEQSVSSLFD